MGHGTGVHNAVFVIFFLRGVTIGVIGASSLHIARACGVPQNYFIAARGVGLTVGPLLLGRAIGRVVWSGNSQYFVALALAVMAFCEAAIPRTSTGALLYPTFLVLGLAMATLDTSGDVVLTTVYGDRCSVPLNVINAVYGVGGMVAPYLVVAAPERAWDLLALCHLTIAAVLAGRRLHLGKPKGWKAKIRGAARGSGSPVAQSPTAAGGGGGDLQGLPTRRVLGGGLCFIFLAQATETAMSSWGFTYALTSLGQPPAVAALFPSTFYFFFTVARVGVVLASAWIPPSAFVQVGALCMLVGAVSLQSWVCSLPVDGVPEGSGPSMLAPLASVALIGMGTCPQFAMMLAAIRQHGQLTGVQFGWYRASSNMGNTMGMWLPGLLSLPKAEVAWALAGFCIMRAFSREFPLRVRGQMALGGEV